MLLPCTNRSTAKTSWRKNQAKGQAGGQPAHMRGHADLWRGKIERCLNRNDHENVFQATRGHGCIAVTQKQSCPHTNQTHNAARRTDQLFGAVQAKQAQKQDTDARA